MNQKIIRGYDSVVIDQPVNDQAKSDALGILNRDNQTRLKLAIDATHSGVLTNGRVYPAKFVSTGYRSFFDSKHGGTSKYNKPILLHHDQRDDPIGRIYNGRFTALKVGEEFDFDFAKPEELGGKGSGVVTVEGIISDSEAIKKVLDGRYLTVSAGHSTNRMLCSVCGNDIFNKSICEHLPGKRYKIEEEEGDSSDENEYLCYAITNKMTYHEVSFVNLPAQPPAKVVNFAWEDAKEEDFWMDTSQVIHNIARGKKEIIRNLVLCDEDLEYSLLTGKEKRKVSKTTVTVPPSTVDLLKNVLEEEEAEETPQSEESRHPQNEENSSTEGDSEEPAVVTKDRPAPADNSNEEDIQDAKQQKVNQKTDPDDKHNGEPDMKDNEKDTQTSELSPEVMKASLEALTQERDSLNDRLSDKDKEIKDLKKKNDNLQSENKRLTDDAAAREGDTAKQLAHSVAAIRVMLKKPDAADVSTRENFEAFVEKLAERSVDSLLDSITDHALELAQLNELRELEESKKTDDSSSTTLANDRVTSPALGNKDKPTKRALTKEELLKFE